MQNQSHFSNHSLPRILFWLGIASYIVYKLFHLSVSYYWDESWVYAPAVKAMAEGLPSLLPGSIDVSFSRGHPLFLHFMYGWWIKIFGTSHATLHTFSLIITTALVYSIYHIGNQVFKPWVGTMAAFLLIAQSITIAQGAMVLPEVPVALLSLLSIYFFIQEKYWAFALSATCLLLTKESGIALPVSLLVGMATIRVLDADPSNWKRIAWVTIPCLVLTSFFLYQKAVYGWYFYPGHIELQEKSLEVSIKKMDMILDYILFKQDRKLFSIAFILMGLVYLWKNIKWWCIVFLITIPLIFIKHEVTLSISYIGLFFFYLIWIKKSTFRLKQKQWLYYSVYFTFAYIAFSAFNFYTSRYSMTPITTLVLITVPLLWKSLGLKKAFFAITTIGIAMGLFYTVSSAGEKHGDDTLGYISGTLAMQEMVDFIEEANLYEDYVYPSFLVKKALELKGAGYRKSKDPFLHLNDWNTQDPSKEVYYIKMNAEDNGGRLKMRSDENLELIYSVEQGQFIIDLFRKKKLD